MGNLVSERLAALYKSCRYSGMHEGENLVAFSLGQPDELWSTHQGSSHGVMYAGLLGELLSLACWMTLTSSWMNLHPMEQCPHFLHY